MLPVALAYMHVAAQLSAINGPFLLQNKIKEIRWWKTGQQRHQRFSAVECWFATRPVRPAQARIRAAAKLFRQLNPSFPRKQVPRFIRYWAAHLWRRGSLITTANEGPQSKMPDDVVDRAIELLYAGWENEGQQLAFTSIAEALGRCPELKAIKTQCGVSEKTLLRRMRQRDPTVRRRLQRFLRVMDDNLKAHRAAKCKQLRSWSIAKLRRVFWVDAATIILKPVGMKVYLPPGHRALVVEDPRMPKDTKHIQKLKFYICVNAILGGVSLAFVTGTTDQQYEGNWEVSDAGLRCWLRLLACHTSVGFTRQESG